MVRVLFYASIISLLISAAFLFLPLTFMYFLLGFLTLAFIFSVVFKKKFNTHNLPVLLLICTFICSWILFNFNINVKKLNEFDGKTVLAEGYVSEDPTPHGVYSSYILNIKNISTDGVNYKPILSSKLKIYEDTGFTLNNYRYVKAVFDVSSVKSDEMGYSSDYSENIFLRGNVKRIYSEKEMERKPFDYYFYCIKQKIKILMYNNLNNESAALCNAVLLGDKSGLDDFFIDNTKTAGVSHMLVVSGLHLSIIAQIFSLFFKKIKVPYKLNAVLMLFVTFTVMGVCGFSSCILRAGFTYIIYYVGKLIFKRGDPLNSLGASALIIMLFNPYLFGNIGFLLSYTSTFAIIFLSPKVYGLFKKLYFRGFLYKIYLGIAFLLSQTLSAIFVTLPITCFYFGYFSVIAPVTNILLSHAITLLLFLIILTVLLLLIPIINYAALPFLFFITLICNYVYYVINTLGSLKYAALPAKNEYYIVWLLTVILLFIIFYVKKFYDFSIVRIISKITSALIVVTSVFLIAFANVKDIDKIHIYCISVKNGIAIAVRQNTTSFLIGTGDGLNDFKTIDNSLISSGISKIEYLIIPKASKEYCGTLKTVADTKHIDNMALSVLGDYKNTVLKVAENYKQQHGNCNIKTFEYDFSFKNKNVDCVVKDNILYLKIGKRLIVIDPENKVDFTDFTFKELKSTNIDIYVSLNDIKENKKFNKNIVYGSDFTDEQKRNFKNSEKIIYINKNTEIVLGSDKND